jgi:hypothetical protein
MTAAEATDAQLPSILVGDGVLLPVKIDITMSGNILCWLLFDYMMCDETNFTEALFAVPRPRRQIRGHFLLEAL